MNILTLSYNGKCIVRPDTSVNKENDDFFVPDDVIAIGATPVVFARICKAGKAVSDQFAQRYFDSIAFGIFLYPATGMKGTVPHYCLATSSCFDHSTLLPMPLYNSVTLNGAENKFEVKIDGRAWFSCEADGIRERIHEALVKCSAHTSIRIGDFIAVELAGAQTICTKENSGCRIEASYCGNQTIDMKVNY